MVRLTAWGKLKRYDNIWCFPSGMCFSFMNEDENKASYMSITLDCKAGPEFSLIYKCQSRRNLGESLTKRNATIHTPLYTFQIQSTHLEKLQNIAFEALKREAIVNHIISAYVNRNSSIELASFCRQIMGRWAMFRFLITIKKLEFVLVWKTTQNDCIQ